MSVRKANSVWTAPQTAFNGTVAASPAKGPAPGAFTAAVTGTNVDLSQLSTPAYCFITNMDDTNFVTVGVWDPVHAEFHPLMELLPGEGYPLRLSRRLGQEKGTGTGTYFNEGSRLRVVADTAPCVVKVEAFSA